MIALGTRASQRSILRGGSDCRSFYGWSIGNLHCGPKRQRAYTDIQSRAQL
jgi:hypothetical protein